MIVTLVALLALSASDLPRKGAAAAPHRECRPACAAATPAPERVDSLLAMDSVAEAASLAHRLLDVHAPMSAARRARLAAMVGMFSLLDTEPSGLDPLPGTSAAIARLAAGLRPDGLAALEDRLLRLPSGTQSLGRRSALAALTQLGYRARGTGAALFATAEDPATLLVVHQAAHDSAGVRRLIALLDAGRARLAARTLAPPVLLAEAEAWLGDTAAAYRRLAAYERTWQATDLDGEWGMVTNGWLLGRTWVLQGDLATALHRGADAARAYGRAAALWSGSDAELGATLARVHAALAMNAGTDVAPARVRLASSRAGDTGLRLDAAAWVAMPAALLRDTTAALVRLTLFAQDRSSADGLTYRADADSVRFDAPLLSLFGDEGLALRRAAIAAARGTVVVTGTDLTGRATSRRLDVGAAIPDGLRDLLAALAAAASLADAPALPGGEVSAGATWRDTLRLGADAPLVVTWRLERLMADHDAVLSLAAVREDGLALAGTLLFDMAAGVTTQVSLVLSMPVQLPAVGRVPGRLLVTASRTAPGAGTALLATR